MTPDVSTTREYLKLILGGNSEVFNALSSARARVSPRRNQGASEDALEDEGAHEPLVGLARPDGASTRYEGYIPSDPELDQLIEADGDLVGAVIEQSRPVVHLSDLGALVASDVVEPEFLQYVTCAVAPAVGLIVCDDGSCVQALGTAVLVGERCIITNRHLAAAFIASSSFRNVCLLPRCAAAMTYETRPRLDCLPSMRIVEAKIVHPYWDVAILSLDESPEVSPLSLSTRDLRSKPRTQVGLVGYPLVDRTTPLAEQTAIFGRGRGRKSLHLGLARGSCETRSFGSSVNALGHDCSTMQGNSGSPLIAVDTQDIVGIHFGGAYRSMNYAVPSAALAADPRVIDAGVRFHGEFPVPCEVSARAWEQALSG